MILSFITTIFCVVCVYLLIEPDMAWWAIAYVCLVGVQVCAMFAWIFTWCMARYHRRKYEEILAYRRSMGWIE